MLTHHALVTGPPTILALSIARLLFQAAESLKIIRLNILRLI
jgi:hypothetical protein